MQWSIECLFHRGFVFPSSFVFHVSPFYVNTYTLVHVTFDAELLNNLEKCSASPVVLCISYGWIDIG